MRSLPLAGFLYLIALGTALAAPPDASPPADSLERDYSEELPRIPPKSPQEAREAFDVQPGFRIELVAAEPEVVDPVAMAFDENGRLYVVEMRGYSEDGDKRLGRIRLLDDRDGDGRYEHSTVFLDDLSWPTTVTCYDGGIFVGVAPELLYCKDTTGDDRADRVEVVLEGFGRDNVQGLVNNLHWGLDNRIHGATSGNGATIRSTAHPQVDPLTLRGRDFAIEPRTRHVSPTSGGGQHGLSFDRWGYKFVCSNSDHAQLVMFEDRYVARNPYLAAPGARISIASDGRQAEVFRASPVEPWRIVRTRLRVQGIVPGPVEGGGRAAGYFTGATGVCIYRGEAFSESYRGNLFVGDVGGNLVHRKTLTPDGLEQLAHRADPQREFIASSDIWFRPVQMANGPDGALYILDMYREVIEHPMSLPPVIKQHLDLTSGRERGRIWRVVPEDFERPDPPRLGDAAIGELVQALEHPSGWYRDTALRLLYERADRAAVPELDRLAAESNRPEGHVYALAALEGLEALTAEVLLAALDEPHPQVRRHAVRHAESVAEASAPLRSKLYRLVDDPEAIVRYQLAFTLGELPSGRQRNVALAELARQAADDRWMSLAVLSSLADGKGDVLAELARDAKFHDSDAGRKLLAVLAEQIVAQGRDDQVAQLLATLQSLPDAADPVTQAIIQGATRGGDVDPALREQLAAATGGRADALLDELVQQAIATAQDEKQSDEHRADAVRSLQIAGTEHVRELLASLLDHRQPLSVQLAALSTLGRIDQADIPHIVIERLDSMSPKLRGEALEVLFSRPDWLRKTLVAIESGELAPSDIDPSRRTLLLAHPDSEIRQRATISRATKSDRADVVRKYREVLDREGDVPRGRQVFVKSCAACHRLDGEGHEIGPNLATLRNRGAETILVNLLDPSRELDPKFANYVVVTTDGRTLTGVIAEETATSLTLQRGEGAAETVLRVDVEAIRNTQLSLMPEGLEKEIEPAAMADLLAYLMQER
ncbi:MAG: PVC-type heme-binding CxxCH protein [Pirellulales bacterium]